MSELTPPDESSPGVLLSFTDGVPPFCIVCGSPATGQTSRRVAAAEPPEIGSLVQFLALTCGRLFFWTSNPYAAKKSSRKRTPRDWIQLPHCSQHGSTDIEAAITIHNLDGRTLEVHGASDEYRRALAALQAPPSPEFLGSLDSGPQSDADEFLKGLDKSDVKTPGDFLKGLEGDSDE